MLVAKIVSQASLYRLSQQAVYDLCALSRTILAAPLRGLEEFGPHRVLALLTQDVSAPSLKHCWAFQSWQSTWRCSFVLGIYRLALPIVLTAVVVFLIVGATSYHLVILRAMRYLLRHTTSGTT